jgi:hypothetical protein
MFHKIKIELSEVELNALDAMAHDLEMSSNAVIRSARRLYQMQHIGRQLGYEYVTLDPNGDILEHKVYGCPALD